MGLGTFIGRVSFTEASHNLFRPITLYSNLYSADLHSGNILLHSPAFSSLSRPKDIYPLLGKPRKAPFRQSDSNTPESSCHEPTHLIYSPLNYNRRLKLCLQNWTQVHVKICDFGESFVYDPTTPPVDRIARIPPRFRAPEVFFDNLRAHGPPVDIWSLAVLVHVIFTGNTGLFHSLRRGDEVEKDEILREMVLQLGQKLPEPVWSSWENRHLYFDNDGKWVGKEELPEWSGQMMWDFRSRMGDTERRKFEKMLRSMVELDPSKRATIDEVIASEWFVDYCLSK